MSEDISKNTLLVLVVLTIAISLLGTWTVISESGNFPTRTSGPVVNKGQSSTTGKVSINIAEPQEPVGVTGQVTLNIKPRT